MLDTEILSALKAGMRGELDSVSVYEKAAAESLGQVRDFFLDRAAAEKEHFNFLLAYYRDKTVNLTPERSAEAELAGGWRSAIVGEAFLRQVASSTSLMAAVSAALHLEADAYRLYGDWADRAESPELKRILRLLADWEKRHYDDLLVIQEELERHYFDINRFEPF